MTTTGDGEQNAREVAPLESGIFSTLVSDAGAGFTSYGGVALTRWRDDRTRDAEGQFLYVRDVQTGALWSAGLQPVRSTPERYSIRRAVNAVEIVRVDHGIEITANIRLSAAGDAELRRYSITNLGHDTRELELTTYAEVVLNRMAADSSHPAFSKLFVQTEYSAEADALFANRRARSPDDDVLWLAHALRVDGEQQGTNSEHETDRARFIGRGRSVQNPLALAGRDALSGTTGNVLDPVVSFRRSVKIAAGQTCVVTSLIGAGLNRSAVAEIAGRYMSQDAIDAEFADAPNYGDARVLDLSVAGPPYATRRGATDAASGRDAEHTGEPLKFFNGYGGFSEDGSEYVIRVPSAESGGRPPAPWANVVANESIGFLVTESGAAHTWSANGRENRLTSWYNDPVSDPHGEALYIRDEDSRVFWSPTAGPSGSGEYEVRHGWGYSRFLHESAELRQETLQFVPRHDSVRIVRVRLTNNSQRSRRLSVFSYSEMVLGDMLEGSGRNVVTRVDSSGALFATNSKRGEFSHRVAFASTSASTDSVATVSGDRTLFLGKYGSTAAPDAVSHYETMPVTTGASLDPCAALQTVVHIEAGATVDVVFLLGETESADESRRLVEHYRSAANIEAAFDEATAFWKHLLSGVQIETPEPSIDLLVNGWLAYQNLVCRMWARTAYYQSGGAFGFRDQLQDSSALLYLDASITKRQILLNASHQFVEGDVLHWWHPPLSKGIRTRFSDDLLWLPYITAFYVRSTGDAAVLSERTGFVTARVLEPGEDEAFLVPQDAHQSADVYEHCCMALDRSLTRGANGLPLMGTGDWNDGMNRVGREGRGESVWLGFFLHNILDDFLPYVDARGDTMRAARYRAYQAELAVALNTAGWDGEWYRRAYYDNGAVIGAAACDECQIDAIAQAWAVISGVAPAERATQALDALEKRLVDEDHKIIRLLTPAFDKTPNDPGYIKGYLPGVRENGGQYTHAALWAVRALAEAGRNERAAPLLAMLSSVSHARTHADVETYKVEPYVIAADVYGVAPHNGRGGWTWYTGSAGWYFRVALESILGIELVDGEAMAIKPCIPRSWPGFSVRYRLPDGVTHYEITVRQSGVSNAVGTLDGAALETRDGCVWIPLRCDGRAHAVLVEI